MGRRVRSLSRPRPPDRRGKSERLAKHFVKRTFNLQLPQETRDRLTALSGSRRGRRECDPADLPFTTHELGRPLRGRQDIAPGADSIQGVSKKRNIDII